MQLTISIYPPIQAYYWPSSFGRASLPFFFICKKSVIINMISISKGCDFMDCAYLLLLLLFKNQAKTKNADFLFFIKNFHYCEYFNILNFEFCFCLLFLTHLIKLWWGHRMNVIMESINYCDRIDVFMH